MSTEMKCCPFLANKAGEVALKHVKEFETHSTLFKSNQRREIPQLEWSDIQEGKLLGYGAFSSVYRAQIPKWDKKNGTKQGHKIREPHDSGQEASFDPNNGDDDDIMPDKVDSASQEYAIKSMHKKHMKDKESFEICAVALVLEAKVLANIQHENIIRLHGVKGGCVTKSFHERGYFLIVEQLHHTVDQDLTKWHRYQQENAVMRLLKKHHRVPSLKERLEKIAVGVARAMEYLHSNSIIYRDLKPANIGFDIEGHVKIFDFGIARELDPGLNSTTCNGRQLTAVAGTKRYMAPETFLGKPYGLSADVYSFGLFLWVIGTLEIPFKNMNTLQVAEQVMKGNQRPSLQRYCFLRSPRLEELLKSCWDGSPKRRPSFKMVCKVLKDEVSSPQGATRGKSANAPRMSRMRCLVPKSRIDDCKITG